MTLSKIWSWFIIVAFTVAIANFLFNPNEKQIFAQMITGEARDTIVVNSIASYTFTPQNQELIAAGKLPNKVIITIDKTVRI